MLRSDDLLCALGQQLDERAALTRSFAATIEQRRHLIHRIQRMLLRQYVRAAAHILPGSPPPTLAYGTHGARVLSSTVQRLTLPDQLRAVGS